MIHQIYESVDDISVNDMSDVCNLPNPQRPHTPTRQRRHTAPRRRCSRFISRDARKNTRNKNNTSCFISEGSTRQKTSINDTEYGVISCTQAYISPVRGGGRQRGRLPGRNPVPSCPSVVLRQLQVAGNGSVDPSFHVEVVACELRIFVHCCDANLQFTASKLALQTCA